MSMLACDDCGFPVDTDDDPEALIETSPTTTACLCERCRQEADDEHEIARPALSRADRATSPTTKPQEKPMRAHFKSLLLAIGMLAGLAGTADAGTWSGPNNTGIQHFPIGNSTDSMLVHYGYDALTGRPTWTGAFAPQSTTHFDARTFIARNGQPLGGAYRSPLVTENVADISVRWFTGTTGDLVDFPRSELGTLRLATDPTQALTRTEIETGNPPPNPLRNYHPSGWYWEPSASGTGVGIDIRGDTLFATFFTYDAAGNDDWYFTTGTMTSAVLYSAQLRHCSKSTGTVVCSDVGQVNMTFGLQNELFPDSHRIYVTLPGGATTTLQKYSR